MKERWIQIDREFWQWWNNLSDQDKEEYVGDE